MPPTPGWRSHLREGAYDTAQLIPIVQALGWLLGGDASVVLVWDNLPAHTSLAMRAWAADQHAWLTIEYLPAYAPDMNPVEGLWAKPGLRRSLVMSGSSEAVGTCDHGIRDHGTRR